MTTQTQKTYTRFGIFERIEHFVLILSFSTLAVTGLPQKYALNEFSQAVISFFGGIEQIRVIHRVAATVFLLQSIYHVVMALYKVFVKNRPAAMLPGIKDVKDVVQWVGFNLGFAKERPKMPRYNFMEKVEYWAMIWGLVLMGLTGLMLWNPIATTNALPGEFIPAAKAAHGAEAVLAVLAIIIWHFYNVHIKGLNKSMFTGQITHHEMVEEHGAELAAIEAGDIRPLPAPLTMRKRLAIFVPVAAVLSIGMVALTFFFLTFEQTAIETIPPVSDVPVYVRPTPTAGAATKVPAAPTTDQPGGAIGELTWAGSIQSMMAQSCTSCHGSLGDFNAESYAEMMKAVTPGDAEGSTVVKAQRGGNHPGQLNEADLNRLVEWINAGAPEGEGGTGVPGGTGAATEAPAASGPADPNSWEGSVSAMFAEKCTLCHGDQGGFNAETYAGVMQAVTPGDADNSKVILAQIGQHPGLFDNAQFDAVKAWIAAGAPER